MDGILYFGIVFICIVLIIIIYDMGVLSDKLSMIIKLRHIHPHLSEGFKNINYKDSYDNLKDFICNDDIGFPKPRDGQRMPGPQNAQGLSTYHHQDHYANYPSIAPITNSYTTSLYHD
jgi:hypothetical protein